MREELKERQALVREELNERQALVRAGLNKRQALLRKEFNKEMIKAAKEKESQINEESPQTIVLMEDHHNELVNTPSDTKTIK